jgi:hypothetical protein
MLWDDVDAFNSANQLVDISLWPTNHVANEIIDRIGSLIIDSKQTRQIAILWVEWDNKWFESCSGVRNS